MSWLWVNDMINIFQSMAECHNPSDNKSAIHYEAYLTQAMDCIG